MSGIRILDSWRIIKLHDVCDSLYGYRAISHKERKGVPYLRITDIDQARGLKPERVFVSINGKDLEKYRLQRGDIVIARSGATAGKSFIFDMDEEFVFASYLIRFRPQTATILPKFIFYLLNSSYYWRHISRRKTIAAQPNINARSLGEFTLPLPPLDVQMKIVAKLDDLIVKLSEKKKAVLLLHEQNLKLITGSKISVSRVSNVSTIMRQSYRALIDSVIAGKLNEITSDKTHSQTYQQIIEEGQRTIDCYILDMKFNAEKGGDLVTQNLPRGWTWKTISEICLPEKGAIRIGPFGSQLMKHELVSEGIRVLGIENVVNNEFQLGAGRFITREKYRMLGGFTVRPGDILMTMMGTVGRSCVVPDNIGEAIFSSHLLRISVNKSICDPYFLSLLISHSSVVINQIKKQHRGIVGGVNTGIIKSIIIPLPSLLEQKQILIKVNQKLSKIQSMKPILESVLQLQQLSKRYFDLLITQIYDKAYRGDLPIQV